MKFVDEKGNPFSLTCESALHNLLTKQIMTEEIRTVILQCLETGQRIYLELRRERSLEKKTRLSDTIHRANAKTMKSINEDPKKRTVLSKFKDIGIAERKISITHDRGMSSDDLLAYDIVQSPLLFDEDGMMTKPDKSMLVKELEKQLDEEDYSYDASSNSTTQFAYVTDVMANIRKVRTKDLGSFGALCDAFTQMISRISRMSGRNDYVMDSYHEGSLKDSKRQRRIKVRPIELASIQDSTPLPMDMNTFWSSSNNKLLLEKHLYGRLVKLALEDPSHPEVVVSQIQSSNDHPCIKVVQGEQRELAHLGSDMDEADM